VAYGVFEHLFYRSQNNFQSKALGGWQISAFVSLQSGAPFIALTGVNVRQQSAVICRASAPPTSA
jgi:hypothetical protein